MSQRPSEKTKLDANEYVSRQMTLARANESLTSRGFKLPSFENVSTPSQQSSTPTETLIPQQIAHTPGPRPLHDYAAFTTSPCGQSTNNMGNISPASSCLIQRDLELATSPGSVGESDELLSWVEWNSHCGEAVLNPALETEFSHLFDEHIALSAVLHGWRYTRSQFALDNQWLLLADSSEKATEYLSPPAKVAWLWNLRTSMRFYAAWSYNIKSKSTLPKFMLPGKIQASVKHPPPLDYAHWPTLRDHFALNWRKFSTSQAITMYMRYFSFRWPNSIESACQASADHPITIFTDEFRARLYDQRCWTMGRDYVNIFPEVGGMICIAEPEPGRYLKPHEESGEPYDDLERTPQGAIMLREPGWKLPLSRRLQGHSPTYSSG